MIEFVVGEEYSRRELEGVGLELYMKVRDIRIYQLDGVRYHFLTTIRGEYAYCFAYNEKEMRFDGERNA